MTGSKAKYGGKPMIPSGMCFKNAFDLLVERCTSQSDSDRLRLVHGRVNGVATDGSQPRISHAWVEDLSNNLVFDETSGINLVSQTSYYERFAVGRTTKYSVDDALLLSLKHGHTGPWEEWLDETKSE